MPPDLQKRQGGAIYFGRFSSGTTLLIAVVGAGIFQLDNAARPAAKRPTITITIIPIRVMFSPLELSILPTDLQTPKYRNAILKMFVVMAHFVWQEYVFNWANILAPLQDSPNFTIRMLPADQLSPLRDEETHSKNQSEWV